MANQKQKERDELATLDKKYQEEKKARFALENQLAQEKKQREELERRSQSPLNAQLVKAQNAAAGNSQLSTSSPPPAYASVVSNTTSNQKGPAECSGDLCKKRLRDYENEARLLHEECRKKQDRILMLECEMKVSQERRCLATGRQGQKFDFFVCFVDDDEVQGHGKQGGHIDGCR